LFTYPFGQTNNFLVEEYFPDHGDGMACWLRSRLIQCR
jgi:hypothetical protein